MRGKKRDGAVGVDFIIPTACRRESAGKTGSTKASKDTGHWPVLPDKRCRSRSTVSRCITFVTQFGHYEQKLSTLQSPTITYSEERGRYGDVKRIPLSLSLPVWSVYALHCAVLTSTGPGFPLPHLCTHRSSPPTRPAAVDTGLPQQHGLPQSVRHRLDRQWCGLGGECDDSCVLRG